jgi:TonB family protein
MRLPAYLRLLAVSLCLGTSLIAQTLPAPSDKTNDLPVVRLDEAEQHLIERTPPKYPPLARQANIRGDVRLTLEVNSNGAVIRVVQSSGHPLLIQAASDAAKQYRYRPFEMNGVAADVLVEAVISFGPPVPQHVPFPEVRDSGSVLIEYNDSRLDLLVHGNGIVEYKGIGGVVVEGKHQRRISAEEIHELLEALRQADFFSLSDEYNYATDSYAETTSVQIGTAKKVITDYGVDIPTALKNAQEAILKYSHSDQWVKGNADTVPALVAENSNPATRRNVLSDTLPRAALDGDIAIVRKILSNKVDLERRGPYNSTALLLAADRGLPEMVSVLLKSSANPHAVDQVGRGALIFGAGSGNADVVRLLLAAGLKANEKDIYGDTALMAAASSGNPESVDLLLRGGADVNAQNSRRQTALLSGATGDSGFSILEMGRGHAEVPEEKIHRDRVVQLLVDAGANIDVQGWFGDTALFSLNKDAVQKLIDNHINLEIRDDSGETALIDTVSASIAELLIDAGANVNAQNDDGETALIRAAERHYVRKLQVLVRATNIDLEHRDNKGETALMKARAAHFDDCAQVLISAGATQ